MGQDSAPSRSEHAFVRALGRTWGCSLLNLAAAAITCDASPLPRFVAHRTACLTIHCQGTTTAAARRPHRYPQLLVVQRQTSPYSLCDRAMYRFPHSNPFRPRPALTKTLKCGMIWARIRIVPVSFSALKRYNKWTAIDHRPVRTSQRDGTNEAKPA